MDEPISISRNLAKKTFSSNAHSPIYDFGTDINFTDLEVFTKGQPFNQFKELREQAPI